MEKELKELARKIAKYPDDMFGSNILSSKYMRLSYYIEARDNPSVKTLEDAKDTLKRLQAGEKIISAAFI